MPLPILEATLQNAWAGLALHTLLFTPTSPEIAHGLPEAKVGTAP